MTAMAREGERVLTRDGLINLAGVGVRFDASGVLHWPDEGLMVVSDLHFEKGSSFGELIITNYEPTTAGGGLF